MTKKAILLLAEGFEEVEAVTSINYLRRAGIEVTSAALDNNLNVKGANDIQLAADASLGSLLAEGRLCPAAWDAVVIPGGLAGSENLAASKETGAFLSKMAGAGKLICAICAAPVKVLAPLGLLSGKKFTCYPGLEEKVFALGSLAAGAEWKQDRVVIDGNIITSRGAGTAGEFACAIISALINQTEAKKLAERVLLYP